MLAHDDDLELTAAWPPEDALDAAAMTAARWAYSHVEPAGADTGDAADHSVVLRAAAHRRQDARRGRRRQGQGCAAARFGGARVARHAVGADRRGARARLARARDGERTHRDRDRARAQHAAGVDLARFPHAAVVDPRLGDQPDRLWRQARCRGATKDLLGQIKTEAEGLDEHGAQSAGDHAHRCRRAGIAARLDRPARDRRSRGQRRAAPRRAAADRGRRCRPICRWCAPTRRLSSRRSATSSPMRSRIRRQRRA